jgi:hypothetical protein
MSVAAVMRNGKEKDVAAPLPGSWIKVGPEKPTALTVTALPQGKL